MADYLTFVLLGVMVWMLVTGRLVPRWMMEQEEERQILLQRLKDRREFYRIREQIRRDGFRPEDEG